MWTDFSGSPHTFHDTLMEVAVWRSIVGRINEVTVRRARLVLRWVTVFGG